MRHLAMPLLAWTLLGVKAKCSRHHHSEKRRHLRQDRALAEQMAAALLVVDISAAVVQACNLHFEIHCTSTSCAEETTRTRFNIKTR